ncbi:unnamed protein product [Ceratitis capitata]|uniref:(Mediterranean fruit fly) hypothetical protein n=1 Tax=Ceratitis capitata TaxID=7213 RepID=A0A811V6W7_CERCA|nr:unnamed protein product [Ceratitis capitata]
MTFKLICPNDLQASVFVAQALTLGGVRGECDHCNANNPVACHSQTVYSLCYNGQPTMDFVTCPTDYICTNEPFVCRPKALAAASCNRTSTSANSTSQCGLCLSQGKVFACLNETTIAFCFGDDSPHYGSLSYCPEGTVCDLNSGSNFCTAATKTAPSCRESDWGTTTRNETGNIAQPEDLTCKTFLYCQYTNGVWSGQISTCPANQWFDPNLRLCSAAYTCPTATTITPATTSTTTTVPTTTTTTPTTTTTTTEATTTTESSLTPAELCEQNGETQARMAQPGDTTCKK